MYLDYFGIKEYPFSITPDPRFLFLGHHHKEAMAHLLFGVGEGGGFVQLTGEVGTGKTTLCRSLLEQAPHGVDVALILNPRLTAVELVASICDELRIPYPAETNSIKILVDALNAYLLSAHGRGRRTVLVIDEAQNLSTEAFEQVRLLTNLETSTRKLLQVILIGQPELQEILGRRELRQLSQRITARYHLTALSRDETSAYIWHRMEIAGFSRQIFSPGALRLIHRLSDGIPRLINIVCDRALLGAYAHRKSHITPALVRKAAREITPRRVRPVAGVLRWAITGMVAVAVLAGWQTFSDRIVTRVKALSPPGREGSPALSDDPHALEPDTAVTFVRGVVTPRPDRPVLLLDDPVAQASTVSSLNALVMGNNLPDSLDAGAAQLLDHWTDRKRDTATRSPCETARAMGISCIFGSGSWEDLLRKNRPAVLRITGPTGNSYYPVLLGLRGGFALISSSEGVVLVPEQELTSGWTGDYVLMWRPPNLHSHRLAEGNRGPDVAWLVTALDRIEGVDATPLDQTALFNSAVKQRVMRFQRHNGLRIDGIVGEQTLLQLNTALAKASASRLISKAGNG